MITNLTNLPVGFSPNYMLCIAWIDSNLVMHRYALWKDVGEIIYFDIPLYAGQLIKKNFRLEIWSTNIASVNQDAAIQLFTSVLGGIDYRYGTDLTLVNPDPLVTNFSVTAPNLIPVGAQFTPYFELHLTPDTQYSFLAGAKETSYQLDAGPEIPVNPGDVVVFTTLTNGLFDLYGGDFFGDSVTATMFEYQLPFVFPDGSTPQINN